jgi:nitronate monooxygenase
VPIPTAATELLGIDHPIVSAPMDAVAGGRLAAAVSRAGGLGLIGGGYGDETWLRREFDLADGARVGCGFITWSLTTRPELLDLALAYHPVAVMLSFGDPTPFAEKIRSSGARLICQVQNLDHTELALQVGADVLVAQGSEAGGHGYGHRTTIALVPEIVDLIAARGTRTPVLAAGGIADGRGLAAALMLGAAGVLMGTRFYACTEALTTAQACEAIMAATGDSTCRTTVYDVLRDYRWPRRNPMSVLRNAFTDRWNGAEPDLRASGETIAKQYHRAVEENDYTIANVTVGQAVGLIHDAPSAGDIVAATVDEAAVLLGGERPRCQ